ncbi:Uncharacterized protein TCM_001600 [Theobroma cacao]|uniref:Uncharacterized protein n=1 Tax=Theobroma cacao TaxID=3641 RepID=A0A061DKY3_THECC|nr:Uncharacterized protein TCM_001600 [Theobroma cacao]
MEPKENSIKSNISSTIFLSLQGGNNPPIQDHQQLNNHVTASQFNIFLHHDRKKKNTAFPQMILEFLLNHPYFQPKMESLSKYFLLNSLIHI